MAKIVEELVLYDRFTNTFTSYTKQCTMAASAAQTAQRATESFAKSQKAAASASDGLAGSLKRLVGGYLGLQGLKGLLNLSDTVSSTTARLNLMTGSLERADALNQQIYQSALRTGSSYAETANMVAQFGNLAGDAFENSGEILAFAEQINKQVVLSGASGQAASAAIYQLTQGLSSGALRGEELNSVMEQTPTIAQTIADYLGMSTGELREFASQGGLSADIVKNAMLGAAEETNEKFEQMPMTWGRVFNNFQTIMIQMFQPALELVGQFSSFVMEHMDMVVPVFLGLAAAVGVYTVAQWVATGAAKAFFTTLLSNPLTWIAVVIGIVVAAIVKWVQSIGGLEIAWLKVADAFQYGWDFIKIAFFTGVDKVMTYFENMALKFYEVKTKIQNFMGDMKVGVLQILQDMINGAIGIINNFIGLLNKIPGVAIEPIQEMTFATTAAAENEAEKQRRNEELAAIQEGVAQQQAERQMELAKMSNERELNHFKRQHEIQMKQAEQSVAAMASADTAGADYTQQLDSIEKSVGGIGKSTSATEEDLKSLVDVAERRYVNQINLTSQTPVINVSGANTGHTAADRQNLANTLRDILLEQSAAGSTRSTFQPA